MELEHEHERRLNERATPALMLDRALTLLRHASAGHWMRGVCAGLPLAAVLLGLYTLVHVVGARPPLALFALLCALGYWSRFQSLATLSCELAARLSRGERRALADTLHTSGEAAGWRVFITAMVAGMGDSLWALALLAVTQSSLALVLVCLPLLCARGALAPSLLARSLDAPEGGLRAFARACADTRGQRQLFVGVELLALLGLLLLFGNLYALTALALLVASSLLGLDVGFVTALIAPDNEIVPLLLFGLAALLLGPLRAAISALAYQTARERWQGADLAAAIDALGPEPHRSRSLQPKASGRAWALLIALCAPALTQAQRAAPADVAASDLQARERARAILARDEFLPSGSDSGENAWRRWLKEQMREHELSDRDVSAPPRFELRLPQSVLVFGTAVLMFGVGFWLTSSLRARKARATAAARGVSAQPTSDQRLAEAARLAAQAHYDQGLRSLYAACLHVLRIDAAQTNGQVVQRIQSEPLRAAFVSMTQLIEPCCYGSRRATRADFERARALVHQVLREAGDQRSSEVRP